MPASPRILDVGCGPGRQTLTLARHTGGHVLAVDTHQPYLDQVAQRASREGLAERITTRNCSMTEMDFPDQRFDLIWSEGALYIMGFEKGLQAWKRFLKPKGSLAVTELSWLTDAPPGEAKQFFDEAYPVMKTVAQNLETIGSAGYVSSPHFVLPPLGVVGQLLHPPGGQDRRTPQEICRQGRGAQGARRRTTGD